jgi:hypothetical protein
MKLNEARSFLLQALREAGWNQSTDLFIAVGNLKARTVGQDPRRASDGRQFLDSGDQSVLLEVIWSFIVQGVLVPGLNDANQGWPFLRLTEYGRRCVAEEGISPHDPDGYLMEFHGAVPNADPTIVEYLTESLQCYIRGLARAAAVMLGGASEQAVLLLIDSFAGSIGDIEAKQKFKTEIDNRQGIFKKHQLFVKSFAEARYQVPKTLTNNIETQLTGIFDLIRNSRNDAGHPALGADIDRDSVYSHLRLFIPYCRRIYGLIDWFSGNTV